MPRFLFLSALAVFVTAACGGGGEVRECEPEGACFCTEGTERETLCVCEGGSDCSIDGDNIEFECDGNAACGLACGEDCLVTCPGTTSCTVEVGDGAVVSCPGTSTCHVTCFGDCEINVDGAASAEVDCVHEDQGAVCEING